MKGAAAKFSEKVEIIGANLIKLAMFRKTTFGRLGKIDDLIPTLITKDEFKQKKKEMKLQLK